MLLQSKARLLELNAKLAETLTSKGVAAAADETTTSLIDKVSDISSGGDDSVLVSLIERSLTSITIPDSVTSIGDGVFCLFTSLTSVTIPNSVTKIGQQAFSGCISLESITIPDSVISINNYAFYTCKSLTSITIPDSVTSIGSFAFDGCTNLTSITIPNSVTKLGYAAFGSCPNLTDVTISDGFNANGLKLSESSLYTRETILQWLNALADRTGSTAYTLTIGAANLAKLTEEDILIATNKNWTLA